MSFSSLQRILIGMLGGVAALCTKFLAHDYSVLANYLSENRYVDALNLGIGYAILGPILVFLGGLLAWVNEGESNRMKLLAIGVAAPALITTAAGTGGAEGSNRTAFLAPFDELAISSAHAGSLDDGRFQIAQGIGQGIKSFFGQAAPQFIVYLHYRKDVPYSESFVQEATKQLLAQGFAVPEPSIETGARVQDIADPAGEGPHVDYFPNASDAAGTQAAQNAANRVAALLNQVRPTQLGPFVVKPNVVTVGASRNQGTFLGVWF
jgi:hypothetical protein